MTNTHHDREFQAQLREKIAAIDQPEKRSTSSPFASNFRQTNVGFWR